MRAPGFKRFRGTGGKDASGIGSALGGGRAVQPQERLRSPTKEAGGKSGNQNKQERCICKTLRKGHARLTAISARGRLSKFEHVQRLRKSVYTGTVQC